MASKGVEVYVKSPSGRNSKYEVHPSQKLFDLAEMVAKDEGVPAMHLRLKYQGKTLNGEKTIQQYGVRVETILKAEILVPRNVDLAVKLPGDRGFEEVVISNLQPVSELYKEIAEIMGENVSTIQLQFEGGRQISSSPSSLMDDGIVGGMTLVVVKKEIGKKEASNDQDKGPVLDDDARQALLSSFNANGKQVEVAFSFDTTGSMFQYLTQVRQKLRECCTRLLQEIPNIRISIIAHGDYCDCGAPYVLRFMDLTSDVDSLVDFAQNVPCTSGGDSPECYEWTLRKAQQLDWSEDSAKALVVIGDLYPHPPSYTDQNIHWRDEVDVLAGMGVKVYGVQAGSESKATSFYQEIADMSGGCYIKLAHLNVIADMFLAVCYRETDDVMLETFEQEVAAAGGMTEGRQTMFNQLKEKKKEPNETSRAQQISDRYVEDAWWDISLDTSPPGYTYHSDTDKWSQVTLKLNGSTRHHSETAMAPITRFKSMKKKVKKGCCIM